MWQLQKSSYACTVFGFKIDKFNDVPVALASTAEHIHMRIIPHVHITRLFLFISTIIRVLRDYCKGTNKRVCPTLVIDSSEFHSLQCIMANLTTVRKEKFGIES